MKIFNFFFILVLFTMKVQSQEQLPSENLNEPIVQSRYSIPEAEILVNNKVSYTTTYPQILTLLGNPSSTGTEYWEMEETTVNKYNYLGAVFYFLNGTMESFKLTSSNWYIQTCGLQIKVGNNIASIRDYFSDAYYKRQNGNLSIPIGTGDYIYLLVNYNSSNIITSIEQRYY